MPWNRTQELANLYNQYLAECEDIADQCELEGYPRNGSNYDLRVSELRKYYPELFGKDNDNEIMA